MIPCLYDVSETEYKTNGIGKLADCISCFVTEKRNGSYELKMEYPADGVHADKLTQGRIILAKPADNKPSQPFRIYKVTTDLSGVMEIDARHISYQLNYITVSPTTVVTGGHDQVNAAFEALKENATTDCPFSFKTDITSDAYFGILEPVSFRSALGGVDGSMLDSFGGEFEWDFYTVRLLKSRGSDNGVRIVYGKNLVDYKQEKNDEDVITGVHPYWKDNETGTVVELTEKVVTLEESSLPYERIGLLDCTTEFEESPTQDQLRAYARSYLESTSLTEPAIDIDIDFAQLWQTAGYEDIAEAERVSLCDTVHVYITSLGVMVDAKVTETEYDVLLERYKSITLSNSPTSSRNSSISLTVATTSDVKSLIAMTDSAIRLSVSSTYATKETLESEYSTTVQVQSMIQISEEGIALTYTKNGEVRSQFALEDSSVSIKTGVITFESNSISIESDNFQLTTSGEVTAKGSFTSGTDSSYKMQLSSGSLYGYYQGTQVGSIQMSAYHNWTIDGGSTTTYRGMTLSGDDINLKSTLVDVTADYFNINYSSNSYYYGGTGTIRVIYDWDWTTHTCVSDLSINFSTPSATWTNHSFSTISSVRYETLRFQKGLMVTTLS